MCRKGFLKITIRSALILLFGFFAVGVYAQNRTARKSQVKPCDLSTQGSGTVAESGNIRYSGLAIDDPYEPKNSVEDKPKVYPVGTRPLQITAKPRAYNTEQARKSCVQGIVKLRITFYADGKVGKFKVISGLPFGLTEQTIEAAKKIKFEPAMKKGKLITVTKTVSYNFTLY